MICVLSENVLLEIFDFYQSGHDYSLCPVWEWHLLVQVYQRWRQIILASPHRLDLRIICTYGSPVRENLDIWPAFSIVLDYCYSGRAITPYDEDNVIAALEHHDRVRDVRLEVTGSQLAHMAMVMQEPFTVLTHLYIHSSDKIILSGIPYPPLPILLLSASGLIELSLHKIPSTGYISPKAMVMGLAAVPRLESLLIEFQLPIRPNQVHLPPSPVARTVLPALTSFEFQGASEYLEDLVSQIDSPRLDRILMVYLNQLVDFQVAQLSRFIHRSVGPKLTRFGHAEVGFFGDWVAFDYPHVNHPKWYACHASTVISCKGIDWQVSHMAQVLSHFPATLSNVVHLKLAAQPNEGRRVEHTDDVEWLNLLRQFSAVQMLHVSQELVGCIALVLEDVAAGMVAEVLPSLDSIWLVGQPPSSIGTFVAARQLSGHPVTVSDTETEFDGTQDSDSFNVSEYLSE
ncbi:hypothetical protein EDB89DRAFT_2070494 [Lactarius sanguifluus]|nr:hypothetical protein EDB89DRAFT_2070494 [Lactarius sanguifluus]